MEITDFRAAVGHFTETFHARSIHGGIHHATPEFVSRHAPFECLSASACWDAVGGIGSANAWASEPAAVGSPGELAAVRCTAADRRTGQNAANAFAATRLSVLERSDVPHTGALRSAGNR